MALYPKQSKSMVLDLIRASNPSLPVELTADNCDFSDPNTIATPSGSIVNTEVTVVPFYTAGYIGKKKFQYRRVELSTLFRGVVPVISLWTSAGPNATPFTIYQLLDVLNKKYGLSLTQDDVSDGKFPVGNTTTPGYIGTRTSVVAVYAKPTSLGFTGSFTFRWVYTKRTLDNLLQVDDIPGRLYPGGNDFSGSHAEVLNSQAYYLDFSDFQAALTGAAFNGTNTIGAASVLSQQQSVISYLNQYAGSSFTIDDVNKDTPNSLFGATCALYNLPNSSVPEANSTSYNRCVVITPSPSHPLANLAGELIIHFNV